MGERIFGTLEPVRRRQWAMRVLRGAVMGLLASSLAGIALGAWRWWGSGGIAPIWSGLLLAAGPVVGALIGAASGRGWSRAASAVDAFYHLKDRAVTAVDFARRPEVTALHELQLADAEEYLGQVDPRRVAPMRLPRILPYAAAACVLALGLLFWPRTGVQASPPRPLDQVLAAAEEARASVEELENVAEKEKDQKLQELVKQLIEKIEEMKQPGVDVKEALAKLSEMQATIAAQQALYNVGLMDAQMQALGEALASTQALENAGNALQQQKYDKAAQALEQAEPKFDRKEAKALQEKLKQAAQAMGDAGLGELSEATSQLAESLNDEAAQGACQKLGKLARAHGRRKMIHDLLTLQSRNLSECKGNCQKNSTVRIRLKQKSDRPTSTWGMGISGNTDGEKSKLDADRQKELVQGQAGEGPSEVETTHSPEGRQLASRNYREQYQKYRKMTEAALNSEPIPLGHRQTIRRYFELIRPQGEEVEQSSVKPPAAPGE
jgi:hypothetical protein